MQNLMPSVQEPPCDQPNDFARFVQQQATAANQQSGNKVSSNQTANKVFSLLSGMRNIPVNESSTAGQNLQKKHIGLFPLGPQESETSNNSRAMTQGTSNNGYAMFSPNLNKESSPIMEENSCSDNLSNLGQGPSPLKKHAQQQ